MVPSLRTGVVVGGACVIGAGAGLHWLRSRSEIVRLDKELLSHVVAVSEDIHVVSDQSDWSQALVDILTKISNLSISMKSVKKNSKIS